MALGALKLADRLAVPIEAEPFEPVENRVDRRLRRPLAIGVLDAQQELAARVLGVEPVEQRRARAADMQEAGRRRREAGYDLRHLRKARRQELSSQRAKRRGSLSSRLRFVDEQAAASSRMSGGGKGACCARRRRGHFPRRHRGASLGSRTIASSAAAMDFVFMLTRNDATVRTRSTSSRSRGRSAFATSASRMSAPTRPCCKA